MKINRSDRRVFHRYRTCTVVNHQFQRATMLLLFPCCTDSYVRTGVVAYHTGEREQKILPVLRTGTVVLRSATVSTGSNLQFYRS